MSQTPRNLAIAAALAGLAGLAAAPQAHARAAGPYCEVSSLTQAYACCDRFLGPFYTDLLPSSKIRCYEQAEIQYKRKKRRIVLIPIDPGPPLLRGYGAGEEKNHNNNGGGGDRRSGRGRHGMN
jgi:hypothetical protein